MNKEKCNFSFQHYNQILKLAKRQGYKFCFFSKRPDKKNKRIYMRHDVDFSVERTLRLAKIENKNGIVSTFFIRFNAPFYNLFDPNCLKIIKEIIGLGHQIGLHFDEKCINPRELTKKNIEKEVVSQLRVFKNYFNIKNIVSFHCPSNFVFDKRFDPNKFISVYSPQFFSKIKYLSDSRGQWREGCVCKFLKSSPPPKNLQVLIHAEWWGIKGNSANKRLIYNLKEKVDYLDKAFALDAKLYKPGSFYKFLNK